MKVKTYTAKELAWEVGFHPGTLRNLVYAGMPVAGTRKTLHGKPENPYNPKVVSEWWGRRRLLAGKRTRRPVMLIMRLEKLAEISPREKPLTAEVEALLQEIKRQFKDDL